jgi:hypothetical protein
MHTEKLISKSDATFVPHVGVNIEHLAVHNKLILAEVLSVCLN